MIAILIYDNNNRDVECTPTIVLQHHRCALMPNAYLMPTYCLLIEIYRYVCNVSLMMHHYVRMYNTNCVHVSYQYRFSSFFHRNGEYFLSLNVTVKHIIVTVERRKQQLFVNDSSKSMSAHLLRSTSSNNRYIWSEASKHLSIK